MKKLRLSFLAFFLLLAVPCSVLLWKAYANLKQESFAFHRKTAESAAAAFQQDFVRRLAREESRPFTQYRYVHVADQAVPEQEGLNISPLATFPVESEFPGVLGYFQIEPDGALRTPLLPDGDYEGRLQVADVSARLEVRDRIAALLDSETFPSWTRPFSRENAASRSKAETDALLKQNLASLVDTSLEARYGRRDAGQPSAESAAGAEQERSNRPPPKLQTSSPRQSVVFDSEAGKDDSAAKREAAPTGSSRAASGDRDESPAMPPTYRDSAEGAESDALDTAEVDPFQTKLVGERWLIFHRKVWWKERRYVQGFALSLDALLEKMLVPALAGAALPGDWSGLVFHEGRPLRTVGWRSDSEAKPTLLYESDWPHPLDDFHLAVAVRELPAGPGNTLVHVLAVSLATLLVVGLFAIYRLSASQIELSQKKSDFVAAVSHELKTPLASIRMYGEMLMEGWVADDEKRRTYYRHIHDESERLSRLIENVLRLAQLERDEWRVHPVATNPVEFVRALAQRLHRQVEAAGFELVVEVEGSPEEILVDSDALTQILVNLIDNAIKFGRDAEVRKIHLVVAQTADGCVIRVRDHGPGIPRRHRGKIFEKFYRVDAELTRKTRGTGIGLALVKMLAEAMGGRVELTDRRPGTEFTLRFPTCG